MILPKKKTGFQNDVTWTKIYDSRVILNKNMTSKWTYYENVASKTSKWPYLRKDFISKWTYINKSMASKWIYLSSNWPFRTKTWLQKFPNKFAWTKTYDFKMILSKQKHDFKINLPKKKLIWIKKIIFTLWLFKNNLTNLNIIYDPSFTFKNDSVSFYLILEHGIQNILIEL